jgi:hypothetical protein
MTTLRNEPISRPNSATTAIVRVGTVIAQLSDSWVFWSFEESRLGLAFHF